MRFLTVNHLRLGQSPGGIPPHIATDPRRFSTRTAWTQAVEQAIQHEVHAVLLCGDVFAEHASVLEPWGPLVDGLSTLNQARIPVIAIASGEFRPANLRHHAPDADVHWLDSRLDWDPPFLTSMEDLDGLAVHIIEGTLAESSDSPVENPIVLANIDQPDSIWILTNSVQPDAMFGEQALVIEPGAASAISATETGRHGAWLIDTDMRDAELIPVAGIEFASIEIDVSDADDLDSLESIVASALVRVADDSRNDGSIASALLVEAVLTGTTSLYPALKDTANELERLLVLEHNQVTIALSGIEIDATPTIELGPLLGRPDPVGELARLINALETGEELSDAQSRLLTATEQKLMTVNHARVFGAILDDTPATDAQTLLLRQSWATLDALVRQRGID